MQRRFDLLTIYVSRQNASDVLSTMTRSSAYVSHDGTETRFPEVVLTVNRKAYEEGADDFSRIVLGTITYVEGLPLRDGAARSQVLKALEQSETLSVVVAEPPMGEEDPRFAARPATCPRWRGHGV